MTSTLVIVAHGWPSEDSGYGIATRSSLVAFNEKFENISYIGLTDKEPGNSLKANFPEVRFIYIPIFRRGLAWRFVRSLFSKLPGCVQQYNNSRILLEIVQACKKIEESHGQLPLIFFEGLPVAALVRPLKCKIPGLFTIIRSHEVLYEAFSNFTKSGIYFKRLAWKLEVAKIKTFERTSLNSADLVWAITERDASQYKKTYNASVDGVLGVYLDSSLFQKPSRTFGDTILSLGSADYRKGSGLRSFIREAWPELRIIESKLKLILGGRHTETFHNPKEGIQGLGFVADSKSFLQKGFIFINPQESGSGIKLKSLVALASGKLLISTKVGVQGIEGVNGKHFVCGDNQRDLARLIIEILKNPEEAIDIAQNGKSFANKNYSKEIFLENHNFLLEELIKITSSKAGGSLFSSRKYSSSSLIREKIEFVYHCIRESGIGWTFKRILYEVQIKSGLQQLIFPRRKWKNNEWNNRLSSQIKLNDEKYFRIWKTKKPGHFADQEGNSFFRSVLKNIWGERGVSQLLAQAEALQTGSFSYFSLHIETSGFPPDWHLNPKSGQKSPSDTHWSRIPMQSQQSGDLKWIWEIGRFSSAYLLGRAYIATRNDTFADSFWKLVESWGEDNPPNTGAHWKCGQETSIRLLAWYFGMFAVIESKETTPERFCRLCGMAAAQADRVAAGHAYAQLQNNNHSISEGAGLWTTGIIFPQLRKARYWRDLGKTIIEREVLRLVREDGSFVQQSNNYHRLLLQICYYAIRIGELNGYQFSDDVLQRLKLAEKFLLAMIDLKSGCAPNCGGNDGALVTPLNNCDYADFRPIGGCIGYSYSQGLINPPGPWDEDMLWLFGPGVFDAPRLEYKFEPLLAKQGGFFTMGGERSWGMLRCGSIRERPAHADMLHLDLWRDGTNIARDPGSYSYYDPAPWNNPFVGTCFHNTITVDGRDQMERGPRFLWSRWHNSKLLKLERTADGMVDLFEGEHDGYGRLPDPVIHRRSILRAGDNFWIVIDDLGGKKEHSIALHWLLADLAYEFNAKENLVTLDTPTGQYGLKIISLLPQGTNGKSDLYRGSSKNELRGWSSPSYGALEPALSFLYTAKIKLPARLLTVFAPAVSLQNLQVDCEKVNLCHEDEILNLGFNSLDKNTIVKEVHWEKSGCKESQSNLVSVSEQ